MTLPSDIRIRLLSSLVLLSAVIFSLVKGGIYFTVFLIIVSLFMIFEWMRLISKNYWIIRGLIASTGLVIILMLDSLNSLSVITFFLSFLFLTIFFFPRPSFLLSPNSSYFVRCLLSLVHKQIITIAYNLIIAHC